MDIVGSAAIVTGGGSGLGEATARHLSSLGAYVVVFDLNAENAKRVAAELDGEAVAVAGDACTEEGFARAVSAAQGVGPLRITVACAGGGHGGGRTLSRDGVPHDLANYEQMIRLNLVSAFNAVRMSAAEMATHPPVDDDGQRGVVITTASIAGFEGQIGQIAYGSAKAGVIGMTLIAARDLSATGVRVNCIAPGLLRTPAWGVGPEERLQGFADKVPFPKRFGRPDEYARLAETMITNDYLNAQVVRLDGAIRFDPK